MVAATNRKVAGMKKAGLIILILLSTVIFCNAEEKKDTFDTADLEKQISYAIGYDIVQRLTEYFDIDPQFFTDGASDSINGTPKVSQQKIQELIGAYQQIAGQRRMIKKQAQLKENKDAGAKFLAENKTKDGIVALPSGLQYKVMAEGEGRTLKLSDTVECHYKGTLLDGSVFDSSYRRGKPAVFQVGGVIQGWQQALQLMRVGSRWQLFVPSDLAYGDRGAGQDIKPGATLIFDVEIISIIEQ